MRQKLISILLNNTYFNDKNVDEIQISATICCFWLEDN